MSMQSNMRETIPSYIQSSSEEFRMCLFFHFVLVMVMFHTSVFLTKANKCIKDTLKIQNVHVFPKTWFNVQLLVFWIQTQRLLNWMKLWSNKERVGHFLAHLSAEACVSVYTNNSVHLKLKIMSIVVISWMDFVHQQKKQIYSLLICYVHSQYVINNAKMCMNPFRPRRTTETLAPAPAGQACLTSHPATAGTAFPPDHCTNYIFINSSTSSWAVSWLSKSSLSLPPPALPGHKALPCLPSHSEPGQQSTAPPLTCLQTQTTGIHLMGQKLWGKGERDRHELCSLTAAADQNHVWTGMASKQMCACSFVTVVIYILVWLKTLSLVRKLPETTV